MAATHGEAQVLVLEREARSRGYVASGAEPGLPGARVGLRCTQALKSSGGTEML